MNCNAVAGSRCDDMYYRISRVLTHATLGQVSAQCNRNQEKRRSAVTLTTGRAPYVPTERLIMSGVVQGMPGVPGHCRKEVAHYRANGAQGTTTVVRVKRQRKKMRYTTTANGAAVQSGHPRLESVLQIAGESAGAAAPPSDSQRASPIANRGS